MTDYDFYRSVSSLVAESVREGFAPWLKDVHAGEREVPHDPFTGRMYNNVNGQYLDLVAAKNGWSDPRWVTVDDIENSGGALKTRYGERPTFIARQNKYKLPEHGETAVTEYFQVYNASQLKGMPPYEFGKVTQYTKERRDNYENNTESPLSLSQELTKFYFAKQLSIGMLEALSAEPVARYNLALATMSDYRAPNDLSHVNKLTHVQNPEEIGRAHV